MTKSSLPFLHGGGFTKQIPVLSAFNSEDGGPHCLQQMEPTHVPLVAPILSGQAHLGWTSLPGLISRTILSFNLFRDLSEQLLHLDDAVSCIKTIKKKHLFGLCHQGPSVFGDSC